MRAKFVLATPTILFPQKCGQNSHTLVIRLRVAGVVFTAYTPTLSCPSSPLPRQKKECKNSPNQCKLTPKSTTTTRWSNRACLRRAPALSLKMCANCGVTCGPTTQCPTPVRWTTLSIDNHWTYPPPMRSDPFPCTANS